MPKQAVILVPDTFEMPNVEFVNPEIWPLVICQTIEILKLQAVKAPYIGENSNTNDTAGINMESLVKENHVLAEKIEELNRSFEEKLTSRVKEIKQTYIEKINETEENARQELKKEREIYKSNVNEAVELEKNRYKQLQNNYNQELQEYNIKLNNIKIELKEEKEQARKRYQERIESYKSSFQEEIKRLNDVIVSDKQMFFQEKEQLNNKISLLEEQILQVLKNNNDNVQQYINENISRHTLDLTSQIKLISDPILKFYGGTNMEKGNLGENFVENLLKDNTFSDAIIEDVSGKTAAGDRLFRWRKLKCLIEVKNKRKLTRDDIEKFIRDVTTSTETNKINCGLFISLLTNEYPGRSRELIQVDYINHVPVIFIYVTDQNQIIYALTCLEKLINTDNKDSTKEIKLLSNYFVNYKNYVEESQKNTEKMIQLREKELKYLRKELENYNSVLDDLEKNYSYIVKFTDAKLADPKCNDAKCNDATTPANDTDQIDDLYEEETSAVAEEKFDMKDERASEKIQDIIINNLLLDKSISINDLIKQLTITRADLETLGGYKNIVRDAKYKYLSFHLNDDVVNKILDYKTKNNNLPSRETIIKLKIITERDYKKINKVLKVKKLIDVIHAFIKQKTENTA
jgi:hypothetical protein